MSEHMKNNSEQYLIESIEAKSRVVKCVFNNVKYADIIFDIRGKKFYASMNIIESVCENFYNSLQKYDSQFIYCQHY